MHQKKLIGSREAGEYLGFSQEWVQRNAVRLGIPYLEVNRRRYFTVSDLQTWMEGTRSQTSHTQTRSHGRNNPSQMRINLSKKSA
jgi:hypothetical protein